MSATLDAIADRAAVDTVLRFTAAFDALDADEMCRWFAVDGSWRRPSGVVTGHDGIHGVVDAIAPGTVMRHIVTNLRSRSIDGGCVVESYFTVYLARGGAMPLHPNAIGRYTDRVADVGGRWVLTDRHVVVDLG